MNKSSTKPKERLTLENIGQKFHQGQLLEIKNGNLLVLFDPEAMFQIDGEYRYALPCLTYYSVKVTDNS